MTLKHRKWNKNALLLPVNGIKVQLLSTMTDTRRRPRSYKGQNVVSIDEQYGSNNKGYDNH